MNKTAKKMFYQIDNGDTKITCDLPGLTALLEAEASDFTKDTNREEKPQWVITLFWMTQKQYENLPEAY